LKNLRPYQLILATSAFIALATWLLLSILYLLGTSLSLLEIFVSGIFLGAVSYAIHFIAVERFLNSRIKLIYRAIRKGKISNDNNFSVSMTEDVLQNVSLEASQFLDQRNQEISKLKEQEEFRREFLGNLAHELKTPVFSIQGYVLTLLEGGLEDENVNRLFLERASRAVDRMTAILDDLDDITKLEADRIHMEMKRFDIVKLAKEVIEGLDLLAKERTIQLKFNKKYEPIFVHGDRSKIGQVFTNLIKNSINYGNEGGETLIRFFPMEDTILVEVADNGPGIEEKEIPRLFERFYRVEKSRNRNEGGSGLGLAIVRHIVEAHGQAINVRSTVGVGSTFSFTLERSR
jgi:two-component system, OmpR family, phosphate regulon sensor histidine kinase PhoR